MPDLKDPRGWEHELPGRTTISARRSVVFVRRQPAGFFPPSARGSPPPVLDLLRSPRVLPPGRVACTLEKKKKAPEPAGRGTPTGRKKPRQGDDKAATPLPEKPKGDPQKKKALKIRRTRFGKI